MESCKCNPGAGGGKEFELSGDEENNILHQKISLGLR